MKKQGKVYQASKTIRAARKRLLAASQGCIKGFLDTYELDVWYDCDTKLLYTYCWLGTDLYYGTKPVNFN